MRTTVHALIVSAIGASMLLAACSGTTPEELLTSARTYLANGNAKAAVVQLKNVLERQPDSREARYLFGKALLEVGEATAASVELRKALDANHPAVQVVPLLAKSLIVMGHYQKLVDEFGDIDLAEPTAAADLSTSIASAYSALGKPEQAAASISAALSAVPDYPPTLMLQAKLAANDRNYDAAFALIDKVIAAVPGDPKAWHYKGEFLLFGKRDLAGAASAFHAALKLNPDHVAARSDLITLLVGQHDLKGAAEQVEALRKTLPNNPQTAFFDAQLAFLNNNPKKALELITEVLKVAPDDVKVLQLAGTIQVGSGLLREAERTFSKALVLSPNLPVARRHLARIFLRLGEPAKALATLAPLLSGTHPATEAQDYELAGEAHLQAGDLKQAESSYARAVKLDPQNSNSRTTLALTKLRSSGVQATVAELQSIAANDKGTSADLALISVHMRTKEFPAALKAIEALEAKEPKKPTAANLRGSVQLLNNDAAAARRSFEHALSIDPINVPAAANLASLDLKDNKPDAARKRFEGMLAIDPNNLNALLSIAEIRKGEGASDDEVAGLLTKAAKLNPTAERPRLLLIEHHLSRKDAKSALATAQDAAAALPNRGNILESLGRAQMAAGDTNQAIASFNKLAAMEPKSSRAHMRLAGAYLSTQNTVAAEQSLGRALQLSPKLLAAQQSLFDIALTEKRSKNALLIARTVQQQWPDAPVGFMMEAAVEVARNNIAAAAELYRGAYKKFPSTEPALKLHSMLIVLKRNVEADKMAASWLAQHPKDTQFLLHVGQIEMSRHKFEAAEGHYRAVLGVQPDNIEALNNAAWIMAKLQKPGAVAFAEKANSLSPNSPVLMDTLATVLAADKQVGKALQIQTKALALAPASAVLRLNLAKLHLQAGDKAAARAELEALAKLGDKFAGQAEVRQLQQAL